MFCQHLLSASLPLLTDLAKYPKVCQTLAGIKRTAEWQSDHPHKAPVLSPDQQAEIMSKINLQTSSGLLLAQLSVFAMTLYTVLHHADSARGGEQRAATYRDRGTDLGSSKANAIRENLRGRVAKSGLVPERASHVSALAALRKRLSFDFAVFVCSRAAHVSR